MASVAPSVPPPRPSEPRTLRGDTLPRTLAVRSPRRYTARSRGAEAFDRACTRHGVGNDTIAGSLGLRSDREGAEARSGALPITTGEHILLMELEPMLDSVLELLLERLARERLTVVPSNGVLGVDRLCRLRMAVIHVDALRALLDGSA